MMNQEAIDAIKSWIDESKAAINPDFYPMPTEQIMNIKKNIAVMELAVTALEKEKVKISTPKDDIEKAVGCLNEFTHNWCINAAETEKQNDLIFRCRECEFQQEDGCCMLKIFKNKHLPSYKDFGSMGDL